MAFNDCMERGKQLLSEKEYLRAKEHFEKALRENFCPEEKEEIKRFRQFAQSMFDANRRIPSGKIVTFEDMLVDVKLGVYERSLLCQEIGLAYYNIGERDSYRRAILYFRQAINEVSADEDKKRISNEVSLLIADSYTQLGDYVHALEEYKLIFNLPSSYPKNLQFSAYLNFCKVLARAGDFSACLDSFNALLIQLNEHYFSNDDCLSLIREGGDSSKAHEKAIELVTCHIAHFSAVMDIPCAVPVKLSHLNSASIVFSTAYYARYVATILQLANKTVSEETMKYLTGCDYEDPDINLFNEYEYYSALVHVNTITLCHKDQRTKEAIHSLFRMLEKNPFHWKSYYVLGELSSDITQFDQAVNLTYEAVNNYYSGSEGSSEIIPYRSPSKEKQVLKDEVTALMKRANFYLSFNLLEEAQTDFLSILKKPHASDEDRVFCTKELEKIRERMGKIPSFHSMELGFFDVSVVDEIKRAERNLHEVTQDLRAVLDNKMEAVFKRKLEILIQLSNLCIKYGIILHVVIQGFQEMLSDYSVPAQDKEKCSEELAKFPSKVIKDFITLFSIKAGIKIAAINDSYTQNT